MIINKVLQKLKSERGKKSIRLIFSLIFSSVIVMCTLIVAAIFSTYATDKVERFVTDRLESQMQAMSEIIENTIYNSIELSNSGYYRIIKDTDCMSGDLKNKMDLFFSQHKESIVNAAIYGSNGEKIWSAAPYNDEKDIIHQKWYTDTQKNIETVFLSSPHIIRTNDDNFKNVVTVSRHVELKEGGRVSSGVFRFDLSVLPIETVLKSFPTNKSDYCYIIGNDGEFFYHSNEKKIASGLTDEWTMEYIKNERLNESVKRNGDKWVIQTRNIGYTGWKLVSVISVTEAMSRNNDVSRGLWFIFCIMGLLLIVLDVIIINLITRPLLNLAKTMNLFGKGELDIRADISGVGEIYSLTVGFNDMAEKTKNLMESVKEKEKEKRETERKLLQSQINPHFLYNTLDSIIWMIQNKRYDGAAQMVSSLAKFFRISLSQGKDIIPLGKELEHAISYLSIQNIRFSDKFTFNVDAEPELMDFVCPKLVIQPLLENAVYHGMDGMIDDGEISIKVYQKDNLIFIDVIDNGEGMTPEQIEYILHNKVTSSKRGSGIGVHNVDLRIKLFFGDEYGVKLISSPDEGTTARIIIPKVRNDDENFIKTFDNRS